MMRMLLAFLIATLSAGILFAQPTDSTRAQIEYQRAITDARRFGVPGYTTVLLPTCDTANKRAVAYDTTTNELKYCNGTTWTAPGISAGTYSGEFVWTGEHTFGSADDAANAVSLGETAGCLVFEGATGGADAFETLLCSVDTTVGDSRLELPNLAGATTDTLVSLAATQTLTNKTLTAPTMADFTNAAHDHGDADDGGVITAAAGWTDGGTSVTLSTATDTVTLGGALDDVNTITINRTAGIIEWEGSADGFETLLDSANPTSDQTFRFPATSGGIKQIAHLGADNQTFAGNMTFSNQLSLSANVFGCFNGSSYPCMMYATGETNDYLKVGVDTTTRRFMIFEGGDNTTNTALGTSTDPIFGWFSSDITDVTKRGELQHNQTNVLFTSFSGDIEMAAAGGQVIVPIGTAAAPGLSLGVAGSTTGLSVTGGGGGLTSSVSGTAYSTLGSANLTLKSTIGLGFSSGDPSTTGADVAIARTGIGGLKVTGTAPTVSSCGTSPSVATGSSTVGSVVWGTGGTDATCTLTYAGALGSTPRCFCQDDTDLGTTLCTATSSTTVLTLTASAAATADGDTFSYICLAGS